MNLLKLMSDYSLDRLLLENLALERVCSCGYWQLADNLQDTSDEILINIVEHKYICDMCGLEGGAL
ncbi:MAG TPA: hypothetical protein VIH90_04255 [Candidatus Saccharimonadales bacterium]